jgi:hypothetical protein
MMIRILRMEVSWMQYPSLRHRRVPIERWRASDHLKLRDPCWLGKRVVGVACLRTLLTLRASPNERLRISKRFTIVGQRPRLWLHTSSTPTGTHQALNTVTKSLTTTGRTSQVLGTVTESLLRYLD